MCATALAVLYTLMVCLNPNKTYKWHLKGKQSLTFDEFVITSVNHVVRMRTYLVRISKIGDIFDQNYYPIRTFAHCTYPVRMYVCVHIVSNKKHLHVSKFMSLRNTYIYVHIRAIRASKELHTYTYIYLHILTMSYIYVQY